MTDDQQYCADALAYWAGGYHHLPKVHECGQGVQVSVPAPWLSTFDSDKLTTLVIMAHEKAIRIEIASSAPRLVKIRAHRRKHKEDEGDRYWSWHPGLSDLKERIEKQMEESCEV